MNEHFGIIKYLEMRNRADQARWRLDETAYYRDLGHDPLALLRRLRRAWQWLPSAGTDRKTERKPARCEAPPARDCDPQAACRP